MLSLSVAFILCLLLQTTDSHSVVSAMIEVKKLDEAKSLLDTLPPSPAKTNLEAQWLAASGQPVAAAQLFQKAAEADPSEKNVFDWGNHLLSQGASDNALKIFRYGTEHFPKSARLLVAQGVALYSRREYDAAVRSVCAGVDLDPADLRPVVFLGLMTDLTPESTIEVRKRLAAFATRFPNHAQAQLYYGLSLTRSDTPQAAIAILQRALKLDPKLSQAHFELGKLYASAGRNAEAIQQLESALRLSPDLEAAHYRLAQLYQKSGQTALANRHFAKHRELKDKQR